MKKLFFFLSILAILAVVYLILMNTSNSIDVHYLKGYVYTLDPENIFVSKSIPLGYYTLGILIAGIFSGAGVVGLFLGIQKDKVKAYKRELEKSSVSKEANASKVEVLEAKINTLEKAFTSVVDERTKLEVQIKALNAEIDTLNKNK